VEHLFHLVEHFFHPLDTHQGEGRRTAINLLAGTLNTAAAFSIAEVPSGASTVPIHTSLAEKRYTLHVVGFGGSGFFAMPEYRARATSIQPVDGCACRLVARFNQIEG
jgi:hypothetical protein